MAGQWFTALWNRGSGGRRRGKRIYRYFECNWVSPWGDQQARISSISPTGCYINDRFTVPPEGHAREGNLRGGPRRGTERPWDGYRCESRHWFRRAICRYGRRDECEAERPRRRGSSGGRCGYADAKRDGRRGAESRKA